MKPTELMIGDWVLRDGEPLRVVLIDDYLDFKVVATTLNHSYVGKAAGLQPVPLTEEILEKNGFKKNAMYQVLRIDENFELWYYPHLGSLRYEYKGELIFKTSGGLNYIHELQHALRLAGINKEIEL